MEVTVRLQPGEDGGLCGGRKALVMAVFKSKDREPLGAAENLQRCGSPASVDGFPLWPPGKHPSRLSDAPQPRCVTPFCPKPPPLQCRPAKFCSQIAAAIHVVATAPAGFDAFPPPCVPRRNVAPLTRRH